MRDAPSVDPQATPYAIVTGHGGFPAGMISAVAQITGRDHFLLAQSNVGLGREEIEATLRDHMARHRITVIFTDLPGGSATIAARRVMHDIPELTLVTGTNLATLLDFVCTVDQMPPAEAARQAADKGRVAVTVVASK